MKIMNLILVQLSRVKPATFAIQIELLCGKIGIGINTQNTLVEQVHMRGLFNVTSSDSQTIALLLNNTCVFMIGLQHRLSPYPDFGASNIFNVWLL